MKIACISASQVPSSTANSLQVMKSCQAISQLGHDVHLFLPDPHSTTDQDEIASNYGIKTSFEMQWLFTNRRWHRYDFALHAVQAAHHLKADFTYVWLLQAGIFSLLYGLPTLIEFHGPPEGRFGPSIFRLFQSIPGKKRILPISHALASQIQARFNTRAELIRVSPNGVDLQQYASLPGPAAARQKLGLPAGLTIGYTGHLYAGRGMNLLVELASRFPHVRFIWVGGRPDDVSTWREKLSALNSTNITLIGFVHNSQVPMYQAACDILLMPYERLITGSSGGNSVSYASPMKMFEYMASRRAIISSDLPVIRELLNPSNAFLCPPEDVDVWSQALTQLINDEGLRNSLTQQAWLDIQQYSWLERARKALDGFEV